MPGHAYLLSKLSISQFTFESFWISVQSFLYRMLISIAMGAMSFRTYSVTVFPSTLVVRLCPDMEGDFATVPIRKLSSIAAISSPSRVCCFLKRSIRFMVLASFLHEYIYSYYFAIKSHTCQERCEHVIKKVLKGLNCYHVLARMCQEQIGMVASR